ncbi:RNA polymerase sigma factor [Streptomyces sp. JW3]|uniref:RNA polymerase sigma factor n=1 Tax=Streptomyces sp. JW3 TaxID=3456955 RepID=UPI003FA4B774
MAAHGRAAGFLAAGVPEQPEDDLTDRLAATSVDRHTPPHAAEPGEQQRQVRRTLIALLFKQRSVMAWHLDGFSTTEIAAAMGLEKSAVLQNLSRARRTLKQQLVSPAQGSGSERHPPHT